MKKTRKQKIQLIPWSKVKERILRDPETKKAYDDLDFEYQIITALIKARAQKKLTQEQLAEKIGVAQSALARFESGKVNPTLSFLKKVTSGLGLKMVIK
ncbi:MAG: XRE family transcriptional regulator [Candidatus Zambryskibacteria bacterium]|nr:XRE family transcriptional regulator [Candidatus Zambryskibacteria bacterium]